MFFNGIFRDKKIFITGHTGFKGSWLLSWLKMAGAEIQGYSLAPNPNINYMDILGEMAYASPPCRYHGLSGTGKMPARFQPDFVFHLAAQPLVRYGYEEPLETFKVNIMGRPIY